MSYSEIGSPWYAVVWPWFGLGAALVLLILLFCTDVLCTEKGKGKWRNRWSDAYWIAWLCTAAYLMHNVEEYGIDLFGNLYEFPNCFNTIMAGNGTTMPDAFFMCIYLPAFCVTYPLVAWFSKKHEWASPVLVAGLFLNAISHIIPLFTPTGYTPGTLTAIIFFLPISIWCAIGIVGKNQLQYKWMVTCLVVFLIGYGILMGAAMLYINGYINSVAVCILEALNGPVCALLAWLMSLVKHGAWTTRRVDTKPEATEAEQ